MHFSVKMWSSMRERERERARLINFYKSLYGRFHRVA